MSLIYFRLKANIFAAQFNSQVVILDIELNKYYTLSISASSMLHEILRVAFQKNIENYYTRCLTADKLGEANKWIKKFIGHGFIEASEKQGLTTIPTTQNSSGLVDSKWRSQTQNKNIKLKFSEILKAYLALKKVHRCLAKKQLVGLINLLNRYAISVKTNLNNNQIKRLSYVADRACMLSAKKTNCLPWAGTFAYILLKQGYACDFVIGVQTTPFYAHAWIEVNGKVVNDTAELQEKLAVILRLQFR